MAYVNEMVPEEEKKEYQMPNLEKKIPRTWTIDREKNIVLLPYGRNIDEPKEKRFILVKDENIVFSAILLREVAENTVIWNMEGYKIWKECSLSEDLLLEELREALRAYGYNGYQVLGPLKCKIMINF